MTRARPFLIAAILALQPVLFAQLCSAQYFSSFGAMPGAPPEARQASANAFAGLAGVLTGTLLLVAIGLDRRPSPARAAARVHPTSEVMNVKNSQVAVICAAILAGAMIIAGSIILLVLGLVRHEPDVGATVTEPEAAAAPAVRAPGAARE